MTTKTFKTDLKPGDTVTIGDSIVRLEKKSGQVARLVIEAPESTPISTTNARTRTSAAGDTRKSAFQPQ